MDYKVLNLKQYSPSTEQAMAIFQINMESYKLEGVRAVKIIHGYGSHGVGGEICKTLRNTLKTLKKNRKIKDYLLGSEWDLASPKCMRILLELKDCYDDEDLGKRNPGITIVIL